MLQACNWSLYRPQQSQGLQARAGPYLLGMAWWLQGHLQCQQYLEGGKMGGSGVKTKRSGRAWSATPGCGGHCKSGWGCGRTHHIWLP